MFKRYTVLALLVTLAPSLVFLPQATGGGKSVSIPQQTAMKARFLRDISSLEVKTGDKIQLALDEDVSISNEVVIKKGANVNAEVIESVLPGRIGTPGTLFVSVNTVESVDGQSIAVKGTVKSRGISRRTKSIVLAICVFPAFLLLRGYPAVIKANTVIYIQTVQTIDVNSKGSDIKNAAGDVSASHDK